MSPPADTLQSLRRENVIGKSKRLRPFPAVKPAQFIDTRSPLPGERLPTLWRSSGPLSGDRRCWATGLGHASNPCQQERWPDSMYCYYHDKVQKDLCEPHLPDAYPVSSLPVEGYVVPALAETIAA